MGHSTIIPSFISETKKSGTKYKSPSVSKVLVNGEVKMYIYFSKIVIKFLSLSKSLFSIILKLFILAKYSNSFKSKQ
jgi:hypothetical protein